MSLMPQNPFSPILDNASEEDKRRGMAAATGAAVGATVGSMVGGPVGAAVGGALGAGACVLLSEESDDDEAP